MTTTEAIKIVEDATAQLNATRQQHILIAKAIDIITEAVQTSQNKTEPNASTT